MYDPRLTVIGEQCYMCFAVDTKHGLRGGIAVKVRALFWLESKKGYAVSNMIRRLQLYYGDDAELHVNSAPERGTEIRISLPRKGGHWDEQS